MAISSLMLAAIKSSPITIRKGVSEDLVAIPGILPKKLSTLGADQGRRRGESVVEEPARSHAAENEIQTYGQVSSLARLHL